MRNSRSTSGGTGLSSSNPGTQRPGSATLAQWRIRAVRLWQKPWVRTTTLVLSVPLGLLFIVAVFTYVRYARLIDARLPGEHQTVPPRVFARPLELRRGQAMTDRQLVDRLNDLGYAQRASVERPGEFAVLPGAVAIKPRGAEFRGETVRVVFSRALADARPGRRP